MAKKKVDPKVIATKQDYELSYICKTWGDKNGKHLKVGTLKDIISKLGHSRRRINAVLIYLGYSYKPRKKK